jgi:hypothetical protein
MVMVRRDELAEGHSASVRGLQEVDELAREQGKLTGQWRSSGRLRTHLQNKTNFKEVFLSFEFTNT